MTLTDYINAHPDQTGEEIAEALSTPAVTTRPYYASYRTVAACCGVLVAEWIAAALKSQAPTAYEVYRIPGDTNGKGGGLDVSDPTTQGFLAQLVAASDVSGGPFNADERAKLITLGEVKTYLLGRTYTADEVIAARMAIALAAAKDARLSALETYASGVRTAVNAATSIDDLPEIPTP